MSRLESFRRRLTAQIDGLDWATAEIAGLEGDVLELGLGNGRTYDHLRERLPGRRIWVIDRVMRAHPDCIPPENDFLNGEADDMLARLAKAGVRMALAHYDFGTGDHPADAAEGARLAPLIAAVMAPGGLIVAQQKMPGMHEIAGPDAVDPGRYHFYRAES
ncbi:class I SAM-dependent methyltransferase [Sulfitobacter sp. D35]|uniref:class I SAM-dependent methyltransferase n=1 Tax=Sulfitobacter sp. D35 TaxID=3083252 RepID=UPI00296F65CE|nr:class I SAM-dependent methyltransferase [Sulfitobacter sp. D35]MDW4499712.1 class I SAM-dependent methyltransferase [Sulfitobacter sp. D35]